MLIRILDPPCKEMDADQEINNQDNNYLSFFKSSDSGIERFRIRIQEAKILRI